MDSKFLYKTLSNKAVQLLAQRNHTTTELKQKLLIFSKRSFKDYDDIIDCIHTQIDCVIQYCIDHNWLDNKAYIEQYIDMRARKGYGKSRILMELKQKELDNSLIVEVMNNKDIDWLTLGIVQAQKKFRQIDKKNIQQKAKLYQFLLYRGFTQDEVNRIYSFL